MENVDFASAKLNGNHTTARIIIQDHINNMELVEEVDIIFDALLVERLQNHVPGTVCCVAGAAHRLLSKVAGMPAEASLADPPLWSAVKRQAHVFQFDHSVNRFFCQHFRGILIAEIITPLYSVIGVPEWIILFQIAKCRADPTLRGMLSGLKLTDSVDSLALLYLATIQAIAHGTRHILSALAEQGYRVDTLLACGGDTKNPLFFREHADICGVRVALPKEPEAVLLGSALLGAVAAGRYASVVEAMGAMSAAGRYFYDFDGLAPGGRHDDRRLHGVQ